jgi:hypothetical protein
MKKVLGVFVAMLILAAFVPRPAVAGVTFDLGIKGGISLARVNWVDLGVEDPSTMLTQPVFGAFVAINLNQVFTVQPEVYLLTRGGKWSEPIGESINTWTEKWKFIHIPLLAKVHLMQGGKTIPVLFAGPAVNFNLSAKGKVFTDGALDYDYEFKEYVKSPTLSLVFGGGAEMKMEKIMLILDIRYDLGLTNPVKFVDENAKFGTLMFMVGIGF